MKISIPNFYSRLYLKHSYKKYKFKITIILLAICFSKYNILQAQTISTQGKNIIGTCGDTLILKGINYAIYNWGWDINENFTSEIAKTGANSIRLNWYKNAGNITPTTLFNNAVHLDSALAKAVRNKLIPILTLHDETCKNNSAKIIALSQWFTQASIAQVLKKYEHSLIVNIANEALNVMWANDKPLAKTAFINMYKSSIDTLRNAGFKFPFMIDAPDCGQSLTELVDMANIIGNYDPLKRIIFSSHAYWYLYTNNDSLQMLNKLNTINNADFPFVLGEIANQQDDISNCQYQLNYKALLNICQSKKIGWLAWAWYRDVCPNRQVSSTGNFNNLTPYGNDIVNNPIYGIKATSILSKYFDLGKCNTTNSINNSHYTNLKIYPNPFSNIIEIKAENITFDFTIYSINGHIVKEGNSIMDNIRISTSDLALGMYFIDVKCNGKINRYKIIKN